MTSSSPPPAAPGVAPGAAPAPAVEAIYPLSPAQQGMLLEALDGARPGAHVEQIRCELHGELDAAAFERACQLLVDRHAVLRTAFAVSGLAEPRQVVGRRARVRLLQLDWSGLPAAEQQRRLASLLAEDKEAPFALQRAPLLRLHLVRLAPAVHQLVWTHHHILLDGWCLPLLFAELSAAYGALRAGREPGLPEPRPYRDYIRWLASQDPARAEEHWSGALRALRSPALLARPPARRTPGEAWSDERLRLSAAETARLDERLRRRRLTLTALVHGAWALALARFTGCRQVAFGSTVSGRTADLPGIETMIGIFINTIPVAVEAAPEAAAGPWLGDLQDLHLRSLPHAWLPASRLHELSGVPLGVPLYDSVVVVLNYPVRDAFRERLGDLRIAHLDSPVRTRFPLALVVEPGRELQLQLTWQPDAVDGETARRLLRHLGHLLAALSDELERSGTRPLGELQLLPDEEHRRFLEEASRGVYLLDAGLQPVPTGVIGEIYTAAEAPEAGPAVAVRGLPDPRRLHRTGTLGRRRPDGSLERLGSAGTLVTLRGYRVALGEIESALRELPGVSDAAVVLRGGRPAAFLAGTATAEEARRHLAGRLPEPLLPALLTVVPGGLDRSALPEDGGPGEVPACGTAAAEGAGAAAERIRALCAEVLGLPDLALDDNLFEHGGSSLAAARILGRLRNAFGLDLPLTTVFRARTPAALAAEIGPQLAATDPDRTAAPLVPVPRDAPLPLSFAQERLWFLAQIEPASFSYNIPLALSLDGPLDPDVLANTLSEIVRRHEVLRTTLAPDGETAVQRIHPPAPVDLPVVDLAPGGLDAGLRDFARTPFDLARGPLFRAALFRLAPERHALALVLHHAVTDGWSSTVLLRELAALYGSLAAGRPSPLPELPLQYADYAVWQRRRLSGDRLRAELDWWRATLSGLSPLPLGARERPAASAGERRGGCHRLAFAPGLDRAVDRLAAALDATPFMVLLAAFHLLLGLRTRLDDVAVGTDVANRDRVELEPLIGFFVNTLLVRGSLAGDPPFGELVARARAAAVAAFAHGEVPFHKVVEELRPPRDGARPPLVQVLFVLQNLAVPEIALGGARAALLPVELGTANFDLCLFLHPEGGGLAATWIYDAALYDAGFVEDLAADYALLVRLAVERPHLRRTELDHLLRQERTRHTMASQETDAANLSLLKNVRRRSVPIAGAGGSDLEPLRPGSDLPLLVRHGAAPETPAPAPPGAALRRWIDDHRALIEEKLARAGGILFRGFGIDSVPAFQEAAQTACSELFGEYGDLARQEVSDKIYGSTPYPADQPIHFHNESSHMHCWPRKILFCCLKAPASGGETPIVDCRRIAGELRPATRAAFAEKGLRYVRNFTPGLDVSWQEFFSTGDPAAVEDSCRRAGIHWEWREAAGGRGGRALRTWRSCPAFRRHPTTGEELFFNQLQVHHVACLPAEVRAALRGVFREDELPRNVYFGDGSPIPDEVVEEVLAVYRRLAVEFTWQEGDVILLDNMLTAHARNPFTGERRIVVAMGEMVDDGAAVPGQG